MNNPRSIQIHIFRRCGWLLVMSLLLSACGKPPAQILLEDYADSMSNVLDTPIELDLAAAALDLPALPEKRERTLPTVDIREGLLEVWDFQQCGMMHLIAERNSSLGKVMLPSQKMRYELHFMAALQRCMADLKALNKPDTQQQQFLTRLQEIHRIKQHNLPAEIWNGIYASDEISQHFALGQPPLVPLSATNNQGQHPVLYALEHFTTLAELTRPTQGQLILPDWLDDIEASYHTFYSSTFGANLLPALRILTQTLARTADAIEQRLQDSPFCHQGHRPRRAAILGNIFQKYYAGQVQPYMAQVQREGLHWLTQHQQIMEQLPTPTAMRRYQQEIINPQAPDSLWQQWQQASTRHTKAWQAILGQCEMMPGQ